MSRKFNKNMTRTTGNLYKQQRTFMALCHSIPHTIRNVSDKTVEKIKTHILYSIIHPENRVVYEKVRKCGRDRKATDDNIICSMFFACRVANGTDTEAEYSYLSLTDLP